MPKVLRERLMDFTNETVNNSTHSVDLPMGAVIKKFSVYHDGVYVWYQTPSLELTGLTTHTFYSLKKGEDIPEGYEYREALDVIMDEGIVVIILCSKI